MKILMIWMMICHFKTDNDLAHNLQNKPKRKTEKVNNMSTDDSERKIQQMEIDKFELQLDKALAGYATHNDIFEMLMITVHSEAVQKRINDRYLKIKGYDVEELEEEGAEFFKSLIRANGNGKD